MKRVFILIPFLSLLLGATAQGDSPEVNRNFITQHEILSASAFFVIVAIVYFRRKRTSKDQFS